MPDTILITGGAGFIGSSLADALLAQGKNVVAVDNFSDYYDPALKRRNIRSCLQNERFSLYTANIENAEEIDAVFARHPIDAVVHLAARAGVRPSINDPLAYVKTNVYGTTVILDAMKRHAVKKMVFASSSSVYGNCKAPVFTEDLRVTEPISPYAATKSACEQICYTYQALFGIQTLCLRFFTVYGPRQRPDLAINKFARLIDNGQPVDMYGDGTSLRDYTYIGDIVSGVCAALDYDKTAFEIINLGGGSPVTLAEMIDTVADAVGKTAHIRHLPMQQGDVDKTVAGTEKAHALLKWAPKTDFKTGISTFVNWMRAHA